MIELMTSRESRKLLLLELLKDLKMTVVRSECVVLANEDIVSAPLLVVPDSSDHERLEYSESELANERYVLM
jgi:hypothetical protein